MRFTKALLSGLVVAALVAAPLSSASAARYHRGPIGFIFGTAADIVVGAAVIATAPLRILAGEDPRGPYRNNRGRSQAYSYYAPSRGNGGYDGYYGQPRGRAYAQSRNYGPPPGYRAQRQRYSDYGPPPGY